eukprot:1675532-Alexandrium_andersonii.AAC.1
MRRPTASLRIESATWSGRTLGLALVLPFLARGVTRPRAMTSVSFPGPRALATVPTRQNRPRT